MPVKKKVIKPKTRSVTKRTTKTLKKVKKQKKKLGGLAVELKLTQDFKNLLSF